MIKVGMVLMCILNINYTEYPLRLKNVPVKVLHITNDQKALVRYDLKTVSSVEYSGGPQLEVFHVEDLKGDYMKCKGK